MIQKLKTLLLDPQYQETNQVSAQSDDRGSRHRRSQRRRNRVRNPSELPPAGDVARNEDYKMAWGALIFLIPIALFILLGGNSSSAIAIDPVTLCPIEKEHIVRKTYVLIDLSETLSPKQRSWLRELLNAAAHNMATRELLSISQMQALQNNPRKEEDPPFCSPDVGRIGQAGDRIKPRDCDAIVDDKYTWPRNLGDATREDIHMACGEYLDLRGKVGQAAKRYKSVNLEQPLSYIVGGIEDIMEDANDEPSNVPARLIIFSDMLQNAGWFSQYRRNHGEWTIKNLRERRRNATAMGAQPDNNFSEVLLCYLPSVHPTVLATARREKLHRQMWEGYFAETPKITSISASGCAVAVKALMSGK